MIIGVAQVIGKKPTFKLVFSTPAGGVFGVLVVALDGVSGGGAEGHPVSVTTAAAAATLIRNSRRRKVLDCNVSVKNSCAWGPKAALKASSTPPAILIRS